MSKYDDMKGDELRAELKGRDLSTTGTNDEMVARLQADDAAKTTAEPTPADAPALEPEPVAVDEPAPPTDDDTPDTPKIADAAGMLKRSRKVNTDGVREFATSVRTLTEEIEQRLDEEVTQPLAAFDHHAEDERSVAVTAAGRRLNTVADTVRQGLRSLRRVAADLERNAPA